MSAPPAGRPLLATLAAISIVTAIVSSLGAPLIPTVAASYDVPLSTAQWALTATLVSAAVATPVLGRWGSGRLRRPVIIGALGVVIAGTVLAAIPLGFVPLVVGRSMQGVGLGLVPLALAVARDAWSGPDLAPRLALLSVAAVAGAGLGYPVTALVAQVAGLSGAYWFGTALVALTLWLSLRHLPFEADGAHQAVDLLGATLLCSGSVAVLLAVSRGEVWGWTARPTTTLALAGAALLVGWVAWSRRRTRRGQQPLVDLRLATRPGVLGPHVVVFGVGAGMYGLLTLSVILVQADPEGPGADGFGLGHGVAVAGLVLVPYALTSISGSRLALVVARRIGPQALLPTGCAVFASALLLLGLAHATLWQALLAMAVGGLGSGFTFASIPGLIVPHVPAAETGSAMAFNQLLRYLGFAVGSALSVVLVDLFGGGEAGFRGAVLTMAALCLAVGVAALGRRRVP
jgi:predicted MFS family arabinose efflux permease